MPDASAYLELDKLILGDAYTSHEPRELLLELCDVIGPRFPGTEEESRAQDFIEERLRSYGCEEVAREQFDYHGWRRGEPARLSLVDPVQHEFPCISLPYCPPTGQEGLTAEVIDLGCGAPDVFERRADDIRGKIVLVANRRPPGVHRTVHRGEKFGRAVKAGAAGFIYVNDAAGLLPATGSLRFNRPAEIPGIGLAKETAAELKRRAKGSAPVVRIVTSDVNAEAVSSNIIGTIPGTDTPEESVVVCGHYDSHDLCSSANDNAAGITVMMEAARLLAAHREHLARTVRFIAFGCEEIGLIGSHAYARAHLDEMAGTKLVLNCDCVTTARPKGLVFHAWPEAAEYLSDLGEQMKTAVPFGDIVVPYSDHFPFLLEGVPTAHLGNLVNPLGGRGWGHTAADTPDKVSLVDQRESAAMIARVTLRAAGCDVPLKHRSKDEVRKLLEREGLIEILEIEGSESIR